MKNKVLYSVLACLMFVSVNSYAGFRVKKPVEDMTVTTATNNLPQRKVLKRGQRKEEIKAIKRLIGDKAPHHKHKPSASGWEGIVSLVCGITGFILLFPIIPAVIFGALGIGRRHKNKGMAIAGLILGIIGVLYLSVIILLATAV